MYIISTVYVALQFNSSLAGWLCLGVSLAVTLVDLWCCWVCSPIKPPPGRCVLPTSQGSFHMAPSWLSQELSDLRERETERQREIQATDLYLFLT